MNSFRSIRALSATFIQIASSRRIIPLAKIFLRSLTKVGIRDTVRITINFLHWSRKRQNPNLAAFSKLTSGHLRGLSRSIEKDKQREELGFKALVIVSGESGLKRLEDYLSTPGLALRVVLERAVGPSISSSEHNYPLPAITDDVSHVNEDVLIQRALELVADDEEITTVTFINFEAIDLKASEWLMQELFQAEHERDLVSSGLSGLHVYLSFYGGCALPSQDILNQKIGHLQPSSDTSVLKLGVSEGFFACNANYLRNKNACVPNSKVARPQSILRIEPSKTVPGRNFAVALDNRPYSNRTEVFAYYLPQFAPNPINDIHHGKGFTEWTNVLSAQPEFEGHWQPVTPLAEYGSYTLDLVTLRSHFSLAQAAGLKGFVFYYYWFDGVRILDDAEKMLASDQSIEGSFYFCWANENWTKKWDGSDEDVIARNSYGLGQMEKLIRDLIPFFRDKRYHTIDGRPVFMLYRANLVADLDSVVKLWGSVCEEYGIKSPFLINTETFGAPSFDAAGFDAAIQRPLTDWGKGKIRDIGSSLNWHSSSNASVIDYSDVVDYFTTQALVRNQIPSVLPGWDNSARYPGAGHIVHNANVDDYRRWLRWAIASQPGVGIESRQHVVINAWNEWAEGATLEPTSKHGYAFLNATKATLREFEVIGDRRDDRDWVDTIHFELSRTALMQLENDPPLAERFLQCLRNATTQSGLDLCGIENPNVQRFCCDSLKPESVTLQVDKVCIFSPDTLKRLFYAFLTRDQRVSPLHFHPVERRSQLLEETFGLDRGVSQSAISLGLSTDKTIAIENTCWTFEVESLTASHIFGEKSNHTVVVRYHSGGEIRYLERALYSITSSRGPRIEVILTLQDCTETHLGLLTKMLRQIPNFGNVEFRIMRFRNLPSSCSEDLRTLMLRDAFNSATSRFISFLDFDDVIYSNAYSALIQELEASEMSLAVTRTLSRRFDASSGGRLRQDFEHGMSFEDFLQRNFIPIHSYVINLDRIDRSKISWDLSQKYMEDYCLILQLADSGNVAWHAIDSLPIAGEYLMWSDYSQTLAVSPDRKIELESTSTYKRDLHRVMELQAELSKRPRA